MIRRPPRSPPFPHTPPFRPSNPFPGSDGPPPAPTLPDVMSNTIQPTHPTARTSRQPVMIQRSEEHTSELQSRLHLVCRLLLEKKNPRNGRAAENHDVTLPPR